MRPASRAHRVLRRSTATRLASSWCLVAAVGAISAGTIHAQSASIHHTPPPVARAIRRTGAITIDGRLDEPDWAAARPITTFRQTDPVEGAPATERTEVRVLYDETALYIGARMFDSLGAKGVRSRMVRRDQQLDLDNGNNSQLTSDKLTIILDPYHDHLTRAVFEVNPAGVFGDALGEGGSNLDASWDPVWEEATRVDSLGWTAELRIPLSQLRFAARDSAQTWGLQIYRRVDRNNERDEWAFSRKNEDTGPATYGHLTGLVLRQPPREFELLPYVSGQTEDNAANFGTPLNHVHTNQMRVGGDVRYLLGSNLTLDATVNPDFGEVEVDPAVVNLSAFETFYPEKRPFFVSGSGDFDFGRFNCMFCSNVESMSLFYSRRIGRYPELGNYYGNLAAYSNIPTNTDIIGAAKITGRTQGGFTVGVLDAVTSQENGAYTMGIDSTPHTVPMEPLSNYFVARVKHDLGEGATTVGGMVTSTNRNLDSPILADSLHQHAEAAGGDFVTTWAAKNYSLIGNFVVTEVGGTPQSILETQESSAHYFQRPDRRNVGGGLFSTRLDSNATSLRGYGGYLRLGKDNGNWLWEVATNARSPGFEVNDLAYFRRADYVWNNANLGRQWTVPGSWYRSIFTSVGGQMQHNYDGDRTDMQGQTFLNLQFLNFWNVYGFYIYHPTVMDDQLTRGGPVVKRHGYQDALIGVNSDARRWFVLQGQVEGNVGVNEPTQEITPRITALVKPASNVSFSFGPSLDLTRTNQQYDTAVVAPGYALFYNMRYIFANIDQVTLSLDTRISLAFTPTLTLDVYAQPFFASGRYYAFKQFDHPRQLHKSVYGVDVGSIHQQSDGTYCIDPNGPASTEAPVCSGASATPGAFEIANPDFNTRSLRGNAVLRWEYRPGSTIYFVWQQVRADDNLYGNVGNFALGRDQGYLSRAPADDIFLIKLDWWIGR
jgi:hypothetical protein